MKPETIQVTNLAKVFHGVDGKRHIAIEHLTFEVKAGETVAIVGKTGCGKSTFLNILIGLESPTQGRVDIGGKTPYGNFADLRGKIATIFQQDRLLPWRSAIDNVTIGLEILKTFSRAEQRDRANYWLERLGLQDYLNALPHEMSGGMRQRVALARAFALEPGLLIADEAFGHLDEVTAKSLRAMFVELNRDEGNTSVVVTHQLEEAIELGDRVLVFGRPAKLKADFKTKDISAGDVKGLRGEILSLIGDEADTSGGAPVALVRQKDQGSERTGLIA